MVDVHLSHFYKKYLKMDMISFTITAMLLGNVNGVWSVGLRRALEKVDYNVHLQSCLQVNKLQNDDSLSKTRSDDRESRCTMFQQVFFNKSQQS